MFGFWLENWGTKACQKKKKKVDLPALRSVVQPVTGVLETPWLCHAWIRGTHACSSSSIQDCTCSSIRILHLILTGRPYGCCSVEKRNNKRLVGLFFCCPGWVLSCPGQTLRSHPYFTWQQSNSKRLGAHPSASSYAASWQQLGVGLRSWQRLYIASLTLSDLCVCVAFPVSVCVNSYKCLPWVQSFLNTVCYGGEWKKKPKKKNSSWVINKSRRQDGNNPQQTKADFLINAKKECLKIHPQQLCLLL